MNILYFLVLFISNLTNINANKNNIIILINTLKTIFNQLL